ncbi:MAG: hypothetical protein ACRCYU_08735 [Nocardioides sp.]
MASTNVGGFSLKDHLFHRDKVAMLAGQLASAYPSFDASGFVDEVVSRFPELELKQRISWIADCLVRHLPTGYRDAVTVICRALPEPLDDTRSDGDFGDFIYAPYARFVADHGCTAADLEFSLAALREITMRFSAEDAIRAFINAFPDQTLTTLETWAGDANYHVRRLCSEGTRPRLPWSGKLSLPATAAIPILDRLYADPTRYVTRSVANHVNDISTVDPDLATGTLRRWQSQGGQNPAEMAFIVRHATRTLIKKGHPDALALRGMTAAPRVEVDGFELTRQVALGDALEFSFELIALEPAELIVDYLIVFQGKSGGPTGRKVFKLKQLSLAGGERARVTKRHPLRAAMTTRQIYPGRHELCLQINGAPHGTWSFNVTPPNS